MVLHQFLAVTSMEIVSNQMGVPKQEMERLKTIMEQKERYINEMSLKIKDLEMSNSKLLEDLEGKNKEVDEITKEKQ